MALLYVVKSGNSVTISPSSAATLTLEVMIGVDTRGLSGTFMAFAWDTDLENELNLIAFEELAWSNASGSVLLSPTPAIDSSQESSGAQQGLIFNFDGTSNGKWSGKHDTDLRASGLHDESRSG